MVYKIVHNSFKILVRLWEENSKINKQDIGFTILANTVTGTVSEIKFLSSL
jgi:hypothetical protein